jgi:hypothetical protein
VWGGLRLGAQNDDQALAGPLILIEDTWSVLGAFCAVWDVVCPLAFYPGSSWCQGRRCLPPGGLDLDAVCLCL